MNERLEIESLLKQSVGEIVDLVQRRASVRPRTVSSELLIVRCVLQFSEALEAMGGQTS